MANPPHKGGAPGYRIRSAQDGPSSYCDVIPKNKQLGQGPAKEDKDRYFSQEPRQATEPSKCSRVAWPPHRAVACSGHTKAVAVG